MIQRHMTRFVRVFSLVFILSILVVACKKGDTGTPGIDGPAGPAGPKGDSGARGTANVLYSEWLTASEFKDSTIDNSLMHTAKIAVPQITTDILTHGAVLVYFTYGGGVFPLPHTTYAGNRTSMINYVPLFQKILITRFTLDNSNAVNLSTVLQYRYIIIPGGVAANNSNRLKSGVATDGQGYSVENLKAMSYQEVCEKLAIRQ